MFSDQSQFAVRLEWGERGLEAIAQGGDIIVIVDVLSFSTCVDVACARGAAVLPYRWRDEAAAQYADEQRAILAGSRAAGGYSLSPSSLATIPPAIRLVLPSPNGAALSLQAAAVGTTVAACLRNAAAVARFVRSLGGPVAVIACGERWPDGSLRPAWEDFVGAGAVIAELSGPKSPEAQAASDAFLAAKADMREGLRLCASGRELIERGFAADVDLAAQISVSDCVPLLESGAFIARPESPL